MMENNELVCKYCNSSSVVKYGLIQGVQRYFCKSCRRKFSVNDHLYRMKTPYALVADALDDYYTGKSIGDVKNSIHTTTGNRPSSKTVYGWITKFTNEAVEQFQDYHPSVGNTWIADETVLRLDGKNVWCIDIIDRDTRYLLATKLSTNRETKDIATLLERAKSRANSVPNRVLTDGWRAYPEAVEQVFGAEAKHVVTEPFSSSPDGNSELIERWHSTLKERTKTLRGLKSVETADRFLAGFLVFYNYLRPHEYLNGRTPAEAAKVSYTTRRWSDIIRLAKPQVEVLVTPAKIDILSEREPLVRPIINRHYDIDRKRQLRIKHRRSVKRNRQPPNTSVSGMM